MRVSTKAAFVAISAAMTAGLAAAPAYASDRDCGDFASQAAAQYYYISKGGPAVDPDRLDADGDGVVCESNPGPYYYGTTAQGGTGTQSSGDTTNSPAKLGYVVDGDTIRLANGMYVRLIGIDTPEKGRPYYRAAKRSLDRMLDGQIRLVNPAGVKDRDRYGRLLRYVRDDGKDAGLRQIRRALAHARYDSRDGYQYHPMQRTYRRVDANTRDLWKI